MPKSAAKKAKKKSSKYVSVAKARRLKIRYFKRKYRRYSSKKRFKHRMKKYHKKVSGVYKNRSYVGIKWTRWLSLAEFLVDDKWDLQWVYTLPYIEGDYFGNSIQMNDAWKADAKGIADSTFCICSTDLWATRSWQLPAGEQNILFYKGYSPVPSFHNLGPMFNVYRNMYKKWKFVGIKVKWVPGARAVTQFLPSTSSRVTTIGFDTTTPGLEAPFAYSAAGDIPGVANATAYTMMNEVNVADITTKPKPSTFSAANQDMEVPHFYSYPHDNFNTFDSYLPFQQAPMNLRLWINFDKQGYESYDLHQRACYNALTPADTTLQPNSRFRFRRVFDNDGNKKTTDNSLVKSYSLTKPFKFFVRPRLATVLHEQPENETMQRNAEPNTVNANQLKVWARENQALVKTNLKMPYVSVCDTYSNEAIGYQPMIQGIDPLDGQIFLSTSADSCFDPILFGWGLSCDNLPLRKQLDFFRITKINSFEDTSSLYYANWIVDIPDEYRSYGKFKVTYYTRFKGFSPMQSTQPVDRSNAIGATDVPSVNPLN